MSLKSYTLSGDWLLIKEDGKDPALFSGAIPSLPSYVRKVPHSYDQEKWKYDYAYSRSVSRYHGYVWYYRAFECVPEISDNERYRLEFDRVSYRAEVYLNGIYVGEHKHSEENFSFDVTDHVSHNGENLLAVRCFEPVCGCDAIDGIRLDMIPNGFWAGSENTPNLFPIDSAGGILEDVRLSVVPKLRIEDIFVLPDPKTGTAQIEITLQNDGEDSDETALVEIFDLKKGNRLDSKSLTVRSGRGKTTVSLVLSVPNHKLWELNNPTLYIAEVRLSSGDTKAVRFGFKELLIRDGFFFLNGKRIILKCAHGTPSAETVIQMKAMGFNAFRSIQQVVPSEVLDLCDELGFMIIESPLTSWGMRLHENTDSMIRESLSNMVRMHRNHVCIGAFYLFNELKRVAIMHCGRDCLPTLRKLSPNSLFLLSSGRWDLEYETGSVSNPYSDKWECLLGNEGDAETVEHTYPSRFHVVHNLGMGDLHPYVYIPMDREAKNWFRTVGSDSRPIFISECGIGTQDHVQRTYFERLGIGGYADGSDSVIEVKKVWEDLERFISDYGMENVYSFATDICRASDRENGRQRQMLFDLIRSNPKISAFSLTSWGGGNEGTVEGYGVIKETVAYAMQEGWAPLRWALFTDSRVLYANKPFTIEAVLCNEDALAPGKYRAEARIKGKDGIVLKKEFIADYPCDGYGSMPPLAATVLSEELCLPAGDYVFSVRVLEGGCPYGGELKITVCQPTCNSLPRSVTAWALNDSTLGTLEEYGVDASEFELTSECDSVIVGDPDGSCGPLWDHLFELIKRGARVIFLNSEIFAKEESKPYLKMIAGEGATCKPTIDWLYHFDSIHIRHPLFEGIHDEGLLELDAFSELYPRLVFGHTRKAELSICASLRVDAGNCATSQTVGEYRIGNGIAVLNGFRIEAALGKNPYAEQMLLNFVSHYCK